MGWQRLPHPSPASTGELKKAQTMISARGTVDDARLSAGVVSPLALQGDNPGVNRSGQLLPQPPRCPHPARRSKPATARLASGARRGPNLVYADQDRRHSLEVLLQGTALQMGQPLLLQQAPGFLR